MNVGDYRGPIIASSACQRRFSTYRNRAAGDLSQHRRIITASYVNMFKVSLLERSDHSLL